MSADAPLPVSLSRLSPSLYARVVSAYYSLSAEQPDPAVWRDDNPLWRWAQAGDPESLPAAPLSLDLPPCEVEEGPSGFLKFLFGDRLPEGCRVLLWRLQRSAPPRSAKRSHWISRLDRLPDLLTDCDWYFGPGLPPRDQRFNRRGAGEVGRRGRHPLPVG